jgi:hypothetical protein
VIGQVRVVVMPFSRFRRIPSIDPHSAAVGLGAAAPDGPSPDGAPVALGLLAVLPGVWRRGPARRDDVLPAPARRRWPRL